MEVLLSSYLKGDPKTGIFYSLFRASTYDGTQVYGVLRDYGHDIDGTPNTIVTLVCIDDGTVKSYHTAYLLYKEMIG